MSSDKISLQLEKRDIVGKRLKELRDQGFIPVVVHNYGNESIYGSAPLVPIEKVVRAAGYHHPVEVSIGKENRLVLIRDIDYDPRKNKVRHVVFQSIRRDEKAQAEIPIEITGEIPAERASLMVIRQLDTVEVEALPIDLPNSVTVDGSRLAEIGDTVTVADLQVPDKATLLTDLTYPVATVEQPKDQLAEADAAAEALAEDAIAEGIPEEEGATETVDTAEPAEEKTEDSESSAESDEK